MCVGAGNKSSRDPCLPRCWNEAVTRKQGRISARCGLISQGSWPGIERLCHCCTAAAAATAGFSQKNTKGKQMKPNKKTCQHCLACVGGEGWSTWPSLPQPQRQSINTSQPSPQTISCPLSMQTCKEDKTTTGKRPTRQKHLAKPPHLKAQITVPKMLKGSQKNSRYMHQLGTKMQSKDRWGLGKTVIPYLCPLCKACEKLQNR